jgi:hypothetical protein
MRADRKPLKSSGERAFIAFAAAFFAFQIAIDGIHSATVFPFVHYGMFSESFSEPDTLLRYEVVADGRVLEAADFRIYRWDMIQQPLAAFDRQQATNDFAFDKQKFAATLPAIYSTVSANLYNSPTLAADFPDWYRAYLSRLIGRPVLNLRVYKSLYRYSDTRFILLRKIPWIDH